MDRTRLWGDREEPATWVLPVTHWEKEGAFDKRGGSAKWTKRKGVAALRRTRIARACQDVLGSGKEGPLFVNERHSWSHYPDPILRPRQRHTEPRAAPCWPITQPHVRGVWRANPKKSLVLLLPQVQMGSQPYVLQGGGS